MTIASHRDLLVWQKALNLAIECYVLTHKFPSDKRYALTSQIRRAATSVCANIAEGKGRGTSKAFLQFLGISNGSLCELDTHFEVAVRLGYITRDEQSLLNRRIDEIGRMLTGLKRTIRQRLNKGDGDPLEK